MEAGELLQAVAAKQGLSALELAMRIKIEMTSRTAHTWEQRLALAFPGLSMVDAERLVQAFNPTPSQSQINQAHRLLLGARIAR